MIKNYVRAHRETNVEYRLAFNVDRNGGSAFPCDENGVVDVSQLSEEGRRNYEECLAHPERFIEYKKLERYENSYMEPASGECHCGNTIYIEGTYMGASQCPYCGQWYNVFGQELLPPEDWEEDY